MNRMEDQELKGKIIDPSLPPNSDFQIDFERYTFSLGNNITI
jgi:hypothetical protein